MLSVMRMVSALNLIIIDMVIIGILNFQVLRVDLYRPS